jgi:prepilin-type N-terminal cleavage/methylation domain-containing protein
MRAQLQGMKRSAFTLIELVMVIVVLGIISMIATDIIANMYKGYIQTKIVNDLQQKTELLIDQVSKRLQYRIKDSMIMRESGTNNFLAINADANSTNYDMVEWIGYDKEGFLGEHNGSFSVPAWSGFVDVLHASTSNATGVKSPGSDVTRINHTIEALSNNQVSMSAAGKDRPAIVFKYSRKKNGLSGYGWDYTKSLLSDHNLTLAVTGIAGSDIFSFDALQADVSRSISSQYHLAWSAYALVPVGNANDFNLTLRYSYQPWLGEKYSQATTSSSVLAEHVSTFRVMQVGQTLRVKICIQDGNITGKPVGFCKEKAIL